MLEQQSAPLLSALGACLDLTGKALDGAQAGNTQDFLHKYLTFGSN